MSTNPNVEFDRRMRMMLSPEKYAAWRAREDARLLAVKLTKGRS